MTAINPEHLHMAIMIQNAVDRASTKKEMTFVRIYPDGNKIHVGEINGDAALEIQEWINKRKKRVPDFDWDYSVCIHGINGHDDSVRDLELHALGDDRLSLLIGFINVHLKVDKVEELIAALQDYLVWKKIE